jgi:hypothetical protein
VLLLASSSEYVCVPMSGPYTDLTVFTPPYMAIVPDGSGEPTVGQYLTAAWLNGEVAYKPAANQFAPGEYMVYTRVVAGSEDVRVAAGRLRIGDVRT